MKSIFFLAFFQTVLSLNILHLSDVHYDYSYSEGSPSNCITEQYGLRCCRKYSVPKDPYHPAGKFGELTCDSPMALVNSTFSYISEHLKIDLILLTGDLTDHHFFAQTEENVLQEISDVTDLLLFYFPVIPVIPALGNHDSF